MGGLRQMSDITLQGRGGAGSIEGEAVVSTETVCFCSIDGNGAWYQKGHPLHGKTVKDKILVYPGGGGYAGTLLPYFQGVAPKALVVMQPYSHEMIEAVMLEMPIVWGFDQNLVNVIADGDKLV